MIILDLEWNSGCDEEKLEEILQIGAVKVERLGGPITDTFCVYIKPNIHKQLCLNARLLPDVGKSVRSEVLFPEAVEDFLRWCGEETEFGAWGTGDFKVLEQNAQRWEMECDFPGDALNLQAAFSHTLQAGRQIALYKAVEYCGIPTAFTFHNALNDAAYTAMVAAYLSPEGVEMARRPPKKIKSADLTVRKGWTGPFDSWAAALSSGANRRPACLRCGKSCGIGQWFYAQPQLCYARFQCGEHGHFLCTLELEEEQGKWWSRVIIAPMTRGRRKEYLAAKNSQSFECARAPQKRRRFHRRRKEGGG